MTTARLLTQPAHHLTHADRAPSTRRVYYEAAAAAVVLPGAWVGPFPFMHVVLITMVTVVGLDMFDWWIARRVTPASTPTYGPFWLAFAATAVLLVGWCVRGGMLGLPGLAIMQAQTLGNAAAYILCGYWLLLRGRIDLPGLLQATVAAFALLCLAKVIVEAAIGMQWVPFAAVDRIVHDVLRWEMMTAWIPPRFVRLQIPNDVFAIVALPAVLLAPVLGWKVDTRTRCVWGILIAVSLAIAYSRWLWFATALSCMSGWLLFGRPRRVHFLALSLIPLGALAWPTSRDALIERFVSRATLTSDMGRLDQIQPLFEQFLRHPWLGAGLGGYVPDAIRNPRPYVYELQWAQWLMQFGVVGMLIVIALLGSIAVALWRVTDLRRRGWLLGMYGLWLISGLFNPFLLCTRGVIFVFFIAVALAWRRDLLPPTPPVPSRETNP